jgi:tyrosyl-tRNA synthetase
MQTDTITELLTRSVATIYPSKEFLEAKLLKGEKLTIYQGFDPTGPDLHIGHAIGIKKLAEFQKAGHKIIFLIGDFTAMIGDPTDKSAARVPLTRKQILSNLKNYKKQVSKIISFSGRNKAEIKFNSKWLSKMNFEDVLNLASNMTVSQMLERDMFEKRMDEGKPIFIHEFMYPLMQGYDSVAMDVDGELGGNDQTFNMLAGRTLAKSINNKEKFVISVKLLEGNNGRKMGKSEGNMITLSDTSTDMYGKVMSWNDGLIIPGFELCTNVSLFELEEVVKQLVDGETNPRDLKMKLAFEITNLYHGEKKAEEAQNAFTSTFSKNEIPTDIDVLYVEKNTLLVDVLISAPLISKNPTILISSKTEFRRLVDEHAITNMDTDTKVAAHTEVAVSGVYRIGKKRFVKIVTA